MIKNIATLLMACLCMPLYALDVEMTGMGDYFRGAPQGSFSGNDGAYMGLNANVPIVDFLDFQAGGSFGVYNWDGHIDLLDFQTTNPTYQGFITTGFTYKENQYTLGVVYDCMLTSNFGMFRLSPMIDQLRAKLGCTLGSCEVGLWCTQILDTCNKRAEGIPIEFRAIGQTSAFLTQRFGKNAQATFWVGVPTEESVMYPYDKPGQIIAGFNLRAPLSGCIYLDSHGSYLRENKSDNHIRGANHHFNLAVGLTYYLGTGCFGPVATYQPLADNSNFLVDTNLNF